MKSAIFLVSFSFLAPLGLAQSPTKGGWVSLFDGTTLAGWRIHGDEKWVVEKGAILGESATGKYGYLSTEKAYRDFKLRLRFKAEAEGNSGVFFHCTFPGVDKEGPQILGVQVEVDPSPHNLTAGLYESGGRGWLVKPNPEGQKAYKPDQWNRLEVTVEGNHVVTWLNGVRIADYTDRAARFTDGAIALQIHTGGGVKVRWKDIFVQEISKTPQP